MKKRALIITSDEDFWQDDVFPLHRSPCVIIVKGKTSSEIDKALGLFLAALDIVDAIRRDPSWGAKQKYKVSATGYVSKLLTYESKLEVETIEY